MYTSNNYWNSDKDIYQLSLFDSDMYLETDEGISNHFIYDPGLLAKSEKSRREREDPERKYEERLKKAYEKCQHLCFEAGVPVQTVTSVNINRRLDRLLGRCTQISEECYVIEIAQWMLEDCISEHDLMNTILHELCHTVKNCMNHKKTWKRIVKKLEPYGFYLKRVADFNRYTFIENNANTVENA